MKKYFHRKNILSFLLFFLVCLFILSVDVRAEEYIGKHTKIYSADMGKNAKLAGKKMNASYYMDEYFLASIFDNSTSKYTLASFGQYGSLVQILDGTNFTDGFGSDMTYNTKENKYAVVSNNATTKEIRTFTYSGGHINIDGTITGKKQYNGIAYDANGTRYIVSAPDNVLYALKTLDANASKLVSMKPNVPINTSVVAIECANNNIANAAFAVIETLESKLDDTIIE